MGPACELPSHLLEAQASVSTPYYSVLEVIYDQPKPPVYKSTNGLRITMGVFPKKKYVSSADSNTIAARYRALLAKRPFLMFGLPFMAIIVGGSFVLTPATAIRYERHDRKVRQMSKEEELGVGKQGRRVDIRDEYYVSRSDGADFCSKVLTLPFVSQRLAAKDLDDWDQKRVKRLPGESDGVL